MKTIVMKLLMVAFLIPATAFAQSDAMEKLYEKYAGQEGFTSVNISKQMFAMFANMEGLEGDQEVKDMQELMANLEGMKILVYNPAEANGNAVDFIKEIESTFDLKKFEELMVVQEKDSKVKFLTRSKDGEIVEMLMVAHDTEEGGETVVMSFTGIIDLAKIATLSKTMGIDGMHNLNKLDENEEEE